MTDSLAPPEPSPSLDVGKRLSYDGALCTVRYIGPVIGTPEKVQWLGVEWDESSRGKHSGEHQGRRYFHCLSDSPTSASFIWSTRPSDPPRSFLQALEAKYGLDDSVKQTPIIFSGKVVEEVGVDKIARHLATFRELRHVLLDGLRLQHIGAVDGTGYHRTGQTAIQATCPNVVELDVSRNLLEHWQNVADICSSLDKLRILKLKYVRSSRYGTVTEKNLVETDSGPLNWGQIRRPSIHSEISRSYISKNAYFRGRTYGQLHRVTLVLKFRAANTLSGSSNSRLKEFSFSSVSLTCEERAA